MTVLLVMLLAAPTTAPDTVVVCPDAFRQSIAPWVEYRTNQGHAVSVVSANREAEDIRGDIRQAAKGGRLKFVLLVGDAEPGMKTDQQLRDRCVPVHHAKARVNVLWGSEPHIATDNWYADINDDQIPDLAVGRLTADSPKELAAIVKKIIDYENSKDFGQWRRRLNFVAGVGGFGAFADKMLESSTRYFLTRGIPADYNVSMTYGSWRSPYCPDPRSFGETTLARLNEGAWFWVYIGHGRPDSLDRVRVPGGSHHILDNNDAKKLDCRHSAPIGLFLSCYAGAIDARMDCLAEQMLRKTGGPVAVIAGSRVTMPYAMSVMASGLMEECFDNRQKTLGEALLGAKRKMMQEPADAESQRAMLDAIAAAISPAGSKLDTERAEHLLLFNLIGDPLLRLHHPQKAQLTVPPSATAGQELTFSGVSPIAGRCTVELVVRRDRLAFSPERREQYDDDPAALSIFQEVYRRANDRRLNWQQFDVKDGQFSGRLRVPEGADGDCHLRVYIEGNDDFASAAADVKIAD